MTNEMPRARKLPLSQTLLPERCVTLGFAHGSLIPQMGSLSMGTSRYTRLRTQCENSSGSDILVQHTQPSEVRVNQSSVAGHVMPRFAQK